MLQLYVSKILKTNYLITLPLDDDECTLNRDNCEHECVNTIGSFRCECRPGFSLNADRRSCDGKNLSHDIMGNSGIRITEEDSSFNETYFRMYGYHVFKDRQR